MVKGKLEPTVSYYPKALRVVLVKKDGTKIKPLPITLFDAQSQSLLKSLNKSRRKLLTEQAEAERIQANKDRIAEATAEVQAGSGYLSQSTNALTFGLGSNGGVKSIKVVWPDGSSSLHAVESEADKISIKGA